MATVSLVECESYEQERLSRSIEAGFRNLSFDNARFRNALVTLKPNLLTGVHPDTAVITHPAFFRAVAAFAKDCGARLRLVESPAIQPLSRVMKKTGYEDIVREMGVEVVHQPDIAVIHGSEGATFRRFEVARQALDADIVLNLPKLKTHGITYLTGAVKNLFGLIPGTRKAQWHMRAKTKEEFSSFLIDYYQALLASFGDGEKLITVMDAVVGMEGKGPGTSGKPRQVGAIIAGADALAIDFVAASLVGLEVGEIFTITEGAGRGLGAASFESIRIKGSSPSLFSIPHFEPVRIRKGSAVPMGGLLKNLVVERPSPVEDRCTLCYQCRDICPARAISNARGAKKTPRYDYDACIRCYCCMEVCPEAAIVLKKGRLQWVLERFG